MLDGTDYVLMGGVTFLTLLYFVFRGTMNRFQWFPWWSPDSLWRRLYWMVRNDASLASPWFDRANLYFTTDDVDLHHEDGLNEESQHPQYFHGSGFQVRFSHWSFQIGIGRLLQESPWHRELDVDVEEIKKGVYGVWEEAS